MDCDAIGDSYYQDMWGQTGCQSCPTATRRNRGLAANRTQCMCEQGYFSENNTAGQVSTLLAALHA
jgi:hypothetical protein